MGIITKNFENQLYHVIIKNYKNIFIMLFSHPLEDKLLSLFK